ncbi:C-type lectin lectoxin-Thr1-like [Rhineura floridana]|uniref:C-type lectin lectoxin-Thr1-like n=1 Tax=Rhineura floridana TaxID=261503 RepID=UPI002AC82D52|nr:C-type lectin lectoxin-Thr1-like [Rhineura floridana]
MGLLASFCLGVLIASPFLRGVEGACCPMDWLPYQGNCYRLFTEKVRWADAEIACINHVPGGHLASIHSQAESVVLAKYVVNYRKDEGNVWIGLRDPKKNRQWLWTDLSSASYKSWNAGEPNNKDNNEYCVELWSQSGYMRWNDENCLSSRAYLCQYTL